MTEGTFRRFEITHPSEYPNGFTVELPNLLEVPDTPRQGYTTRIEFRYGTTGPWVAGVQVDSDSLPVNGEVLREVRVNELGKQNLFRITRRYGEPVVPEREEIEERVKAGPKSGQTLALVRELYQYAELTALPPAKFVQDTLNVSPATAGRWIRRSKDALDWGDDGDD